MYTEQEELEVEVIRKLVDSYFEIVRKTMLDQVPKAIMHFMVNRTKRGLQQHLIQQLYRDDCLDELLAERPEVGSVGSVGGQRWELARHTSSTAHRSTQPLPACTYPPRASRPTARMRARSPPTPPVSLPPGEPPLHTPGRHAAQGVRRGCRSAAGGRHGTGGGTHTTHAHTHTHADKHTHTRTHTHTHTHTRTHARAGGPGRADKPVDAWAARPAAAAAGRADWLEGAVAAPVGLQHAGAGPRGDGGAAVCGSLSAACQSVSLSLRLRSVPMPALCQFASFPLTPRCVGKHTQGGSDGGGLAFDPRDSMDAAARAATMASYALHGSGPGGHGGGPPASAQMSL
jgi:hypothetical protein